MPPDAPVTSTVSRGVEGDAAMVSPRAGLKRAA
jgi:hypothetical protein